MKDVVQRLIQKGLIGFQEPRTATLIDYPPLPAYGKPGSAQRAAYNAAHAARKRMRLGFQAWKPGGRGRQPGYRRPSTICRWCGGKNGGHGKGCKERK